MTIAMRAQLILDTDMDTDCDDAGALAVVHALVGRGECDLLGVVCSLPFVECVGAVRAINAAYGRPTPVGLVRVPDYATSGDFEAYREHRSRYFAAHQNAPYNVQLALREPEPETEDAVGLYRRLLGNAADGSVTICAIGTLTALAQLLRDPEGAALVRGKVRELVVMAVAPFPSGRERFNWGMDRRSAAEVLRDWPGVISVSVGGDGVPTGARFVATAPKEHPVRVAYVSFLHGEGRNRPSWDLIAALYAVRGRAAPVTRSEPMSLAFDVQTSDYQWIADSSPRFGRYVIAPALDNAALSELLEGLLIEPLG